MWSEWTHVSDTEIDTSFFNVASAQGVFFLYLLDSVCAVDVRAARVIWTREVGKFPQAPNLHVVDGRVYAATLTGPSTVFCLEAGTGELVWRRDGISVFWKRGVPWGGHYCVTPRLPGPVVALDLATGEPSELGSCPRANEVVACGERLVVGSVDGLYVSRSGTLDFERVVVLKGATHLEAWGSFVVLQGRDEQGRRVVGRYGLHDGSFVAVPVGPPEAQLRLIAVDTPDRALVREVEGDWIALVDFPQSTVVWEQRAAEHVVASVAWTPQGLVGVAKPRTSSWRFMVTLSEGTGEADRWDLITLNGLPSHLAFVDGVLLVNVGVGLREMLSAYEPG